MPSPLAIDKEQVKATYLATGCLTETARLHGIKPATTRQWAKRYDWPTSTNAIKAIEKGNAILEAKRENKHKDAVSNCHTSDALTLSYNDNKESFQSAMAVGLTKAAGCFTEMDGFSALESSRRMVDLATAGKTIFGIGNESDKPTLSLNVLQLGADAFVGVGKSL